MNELHGLVLSGGESRRMGRDKGLIEENSVTWVARAGELLQLAGLPVAVMIRKSQQEAYASVIPAGFELLHDQDIAAGGPLRGLLSFHRLRPGVDVLALPCDMPKLSVALLTDLITFYKDEPEHQAWVYESKERVQPFPGIYSTALLELLDDMMRQEGLPQSSMMYVLEVGRTARRPVRDGLSDTFVNSNHPTERG